MARMIKPGMDGKQMKQIATQNQMGKKKMTASEDAAYDQANGIKEGSAKDKALDIKNGVVSSKKALATPLIKPSHKGLLHKELGVAKGTKIPAGKLQQALQSKNPKIRKQANFARNFGK